MKCFTTIDKETGKRVFIPMCWGSIDQKDNSKCCCQDPLTEHHFEKERFNKVLAEKNESIAAMQEELKNLRSILKLKQDRK